MQSTSPGMKSNYTIRTSQFFAILSLINLLQASRSRLIFLEYPFNFILPSTPRSWQVVWFPQVFSPKHCMDLPSLHTRYVTRPSYSFQFDRRNNMWREREICITLHDFLSKFMLMLTYSHTAYSA